MRQRFASQPLMAAIVFAIFISWPILTAPIFAQSTTSATGTAETAPAKSVTSGAEADKLLQSTPNTIISRDLLDLTSQLQSIPLKEQLVASLRTTVEQSLNRIEQTLLSKQDARQLESELKAIYSELELILKELQADKDQKKSNTGPPEKPEESGPTAPRQPSPDIEPPPAPVERSSSPEVPPAPAAPEQTAPQCGSNAQDASAVADLERRVEQLSDEMRKLLHTSQLTTNILEELATRIGRDEGATTRTEPASIEERLRGGGPAVSDEVRRRIRDLRDRFERLDRSCQSARRKIAWVHSQIADLEAAVSRGQSQLNLFKTAAVFAVPGLGHAMPFSPLVASDYSSDRDMRQESEEQQRSPLTTDTWASEPHRILSDLERITFNIGWTATTINEINSDTEDQERRLQVARKTATEFLEGVRKYADELRSDRERLEARKVQLEGQMRARDADLNQLAVNKLLVYAVYAMIAAIVGLFLILWLFTQFAPLLAAMILEQRVLMEILSMGFLLLTVIILGTGKQLNPEGLAALLGTIAGYIFARKAGEVAVTSLNNGMTKRLAGATEVLGRKEQIIRQRLAQLNRKVEKDVDHETRKAELSKSIAEQEKKISDAKARLATLKAARNTRGADTQSKTIKNLTASLNRLKQERAALDTEHLKHLTPEERTEMEKLRNQLKEIEAKRNTLAARMVKSLAKRRDTGGGLLPGA